MKLWNFLWNFAAYIWLILINYQKFLLRRNKWMIPNLHWLKQNLGGRLSSFSFKFILSLKDVVNCRIYQHIKRHFIFPCVECQVFGVTRLIIEWRKNPPILFYQFTVGHYKRISSFVKLWKTTINWGRSGFVFYSLEHNT